MGLATWFESFCRALQISDTQSISFRYQAITKRLNLDSWGSSSETANSLYVGSYGRGTAIEGFSDLDMIFRLPVSVYNKYNAYTGNGQSALLQDVRSSLQKTYPTTSIGADGQVIQISFTDGITFEVVPAFLNEDDSYTFSNSNDGGGWKRTDPRPEIEAIRIRNGTCNQNLRRLCKMIRAWNKKRNVQMGGLLIDTLAFQFVETWTYRDKSYLYYDYMCRDFFRFMADQAKSKSYWRAPGSQQYVFGGGFQYKATVAYNLAVKAIEHETADPKREWSAKSKWREIFGTSFPT